MIDLGSRRQRPLLIDWHSCQNGGDGKRNPRYLGLTSKHGPTIRAESYQRGENEAWKNRGEVRRKRKVSGCGMNNQERSGEPGGTPSRNGKSPGHPAAISAAPLNTSPLAEARETARRFIAAVSGVSLGSLHDDLLVASKTWGRLEWNAVILAVLESLEDPDPQTRLGAATFLFLTHHSTDRAVKAIVRVLNEDEYDVRVRALSLLVMLERIPKGLVSTLAKLLRSDDQVIRVAAAATLRDQPETFVILRDALYAENPGVVLIAASALGRSGKWVDHAVEALLRLLRNADSPDARVGIICHLSVMKQKAQATGPVLFDMLADPDLEPQVRKTILLALGEMGLGEEARNALLSAVRSGEPTAVCLAILSLRDMGAISDEVIQVLIGMLRSPSIDDRGGAVWMLGVLGPHAASAIPALVELLLSEPNAELCQEVAGVLPKIVPSISGDDGEIVGQSVTKLLTGATEEPRLERIRAYVTVIASFGKTAIPALIDLVERADRNAGIAVACLGLIGEDAAVVVAERLLTSTAKQVRELGAAALAEMGPHAAAAIPALIRLLEQGEEVVLSDVLRALRSIGPEAHEAAHALVSLVLEGNAFVSAWAGSALLAIGPGAAKTIYQAIPRADDEGKTRLKAILDQAGEPYSERDGIEVVRDEALRIIDCLRTFQEIGKLCKDRGTDTFTFTEMEKQLGIKNSTLQDQLDGVSEFFRDYFVRFEGAGGLHKDIEPGHPSCKIFDRGKGKKPSICQALGWRAWELTDDFLKKRDEMNLARRRKARNKA